MNEMIFWIMLNLLDWDKAGDEEAVIEPVIVELSKKSKEEILEFEEILARKLYALDTVAHAKEIGEDGYIDDQTYFSPDLFLYSRCVVVANGEKLYKKVLEMPTSFPKDLEFESLLYIGPEAFRRKTGKEYEHINKVSYETYSNKAGWK